MSSHISYNSAPRVAISRKRKLEQEAAETCAAIKRKFLEERERISTQREQIELELLESRLAAQLAECSDGSSTGAACVEGHSSSDVSGVRISRESARMIQDHLRSLAIHTFLRLAR